MWSKDQKSWKIVAWTRYDEAINFLFRHNFSQLFLSFVYFFLYMKKNILIFKVKDKTHHQIKLFEFLTSIFFFRFFSF